MNRREKIMKTKHKKKNDERNNRNNNSFVKTMILRILFFTFKDGSLSGSRCLKIIFTLDNGSTSNYSFINIYGFQARS